MTSHSYLYLRLHCFGQVECLQESVFSPVDLFNAKNTSCKALGGVKTSSSFVKEWQTLGAKMSDNEEETSPSTASSEKKKTTSGWCFW